MTNILVALKNLLDTKTTDLVGFYSGKIHNRANNMGDALEYYVKDLFCGTIDIQDFDDKERQYRGIANISDKTHSKTKIGYKLRFFSR